jgi:hypothetical protein
LIEPSDRNLVAIADEVMAFVPDTIVQIDGDFRIRAVNRTGSPIFRRIPAPGDRLDEVFRGRVVGVIARLIDKAQRTGVAEGEADTGTQLFWVSAKKLESAPLTVVVIQDRTIHKQSAGVTRPGSGPEQLPGGRV